MNQNDAPTGIGIGNIIIHKTTLTQ